MIPALEAQKCRVIVTAAGQMGRAYGAFLDAVVAGTISHAGQPQLTDAAAGCRKGPIQEAGLFGWNRRDGTVVVAPLVAATWARYGAEVAGRRGRGGACFV